MEKNNGNSTNPTYEELIIQELDKRLKEADDYAVNNSIDGKILGRVTRFETIKLGERSYIGIDVSFLDYMNSNIKNGEYLAIRTIISPVVIVGEVTSIERSDMLAQFNIRETSYPRDPTTIMTQTFIELKPISEIEGNEKRPAVTPIDPQSPVFRPNASLLQDALGIPKDGIKIGKIFSGGREIEAYVNLDEDTLVHHVLLIGTTGSGKTTLLKTVLSQNINALFFDRQGDFVRHLISRKEEFNVIMPSTRSMVEGESGKNATLKLAKIFAQRYGCSEPSESDIRGKEVLIDCNGSIVHLVPYSMSLTKVMDYLHKLTPYISGQTKVFWPLLVDNFKKGIKKIAEEISGLANKNAREIESEIYSKLTPASFLIENIEIPSIRLPELSKPTSKPYYTINNRALKLDAHKLFNDLMQSENNQTMRNYGLSSLDLYPQTREAIIRMLRSINEFGIFNVAGTFDVDFESLQKKTIVDLSWVLENTSAVEAIAMVTYTILNDFYSYKDMEYKKGGGKELTILALDEAHEYFPQTRDEDSKSIVEGLLNKLMRLGRVRKISVILATHMPDDLNPLVLQLSNTKIVMRNEEDVLDKLGFGEYADILLSAPAGLGVIRSIKFTDVVVKTMKL